MFTRHFDALLRATDDCADHGAFVRRALADDSELARAVEGLLAASADFQAALLRRSAQRGREDA